MVMAAFSDTTCSCALYANHIFCVGTNVSHTMRADGPVLCFCFCFIIHCADISRRFTLHTIHHTRQMSLKPVGNQYNDTSIDNNGLGCHSNVKSLQFLHTFHLFTSNKRWVYYLLSTDHIVRSNDIHYNNPKINSPCPLELIKKVPVGGGGGGEIIFSF